MSKRVMNIADVAMNEFGDGGSFAARLGRIGHEIGSTGIGCLLTIVPPGKKAFPFHNHHVINELFVILEGTGEYRFGKETYPVRAGDVCAAPPGGPEVAHQLINTGETELKYLGISDIPGDDAEIVEYPDSGKFMVMSRGAGSGPMTAKFRVIGRERSSLDYWDGEE